jgi:hypothetical protein
MNPVRKSMQTKRERVNAATLAMLDEALPKLRESADLNGLLRAQALAQAVATTSDGAVRRKAIRIVKKAGAAGTKLDEGARAATARRDAWTPAGLSSADRRHDDVPVTPNTEALVEQDSYVPEDSLDVPEDGLRLVVLPEVGAPAEEPVASPPTEVRDPVADSTSAAAAHANGSNGAASGSTVSGLNGVAAAPTLVPTEPPRTPAPELDRHLIAPAAAGADEPSARPTEDRPTRRSSPRLAPGEELLFERIADLVRLLAGSPDPPKTGEVAVRELVVRDDEADEGGALRVELPPSVVRWGQPLLDGYEQSRALEGKLILGLLRNQHKQQIQRELKQIVVDSMSAGADVRGLSTDAVPAIAYALLIESLPTAVEPGSSHAAERVNDVLLHVSGSSHELPAAAEESLLFVDLLKLSVALGEAQRYADQLSLGRLPVERAGRHSRFSGNSIVVALAVGCGLVALALGGFALGSMGGGGTPAAVRTTITRERVITHTATPPATTVTRLVPRTKVVDHTKTIAHVSTVTDVSTVTVTTPAPARTPTPTPTPATPRIITKPVVPAACATAIANAQNVALLAVTGFSEFSAYAKLASEAIPAALAHDSAKMAKISNKTQVLGDSLGRQADQIARLGDAVSAAAAACR